MFIEVLHDALRFLVRGLVSFVIVPRFVRHDLDTRLNQAIQALLKRGVHVGDCRCEPFGVETETVVQTVSLSRHTLNYMMLFKPFPISEVLVLLTLIRMKYESVKVITLIKCFIEHVIYLFKMKCTLLHFIFLGISPNNLMSALTIEPVRCLQRTSP